MNLDKKNSSRISLRLPTQLKTHIENIALVNDCTTSSVIRYALENLQEDEK